MSPHFDDYSVVVAVVVVVHECHCDVTVHLRYALSYSSFIIKDLSFFVEGVFVAIFERLMVRNGIPLRE